MSDITEPSLIEQAMNNGGSVPDIAPAEPAPDIAPVVEAPVAEAAGRDDKGRFAPKAEVEKVEAPGTEPAREPAIPPARLREEAEGRRQAEARAAAFEAQLRLIQQQNQPKQEAPKPVDFFEDQDAWAQQRLDPVQTEIRQMREEFSRNLAEVRHGPEEVQAAYNALDEAIRTGEVDGKLVTSQLQKSRDPYGDIMQWHQRHKVSSEVGNDLNAYRTKTIDEFLSDPANREQIMAKVGVQPNAGPAAAQPARSVVNLPPSLNRATSSAPSAVGGGGEVSGRDIFEQAISRRR